MNKEINVEVAKLEIMLDVCRRDKDALNFKLAAMQARIKALETENSVMYAAILEASNLGTNSAMQARIEKLEDVARVAGFIELNRHNYLFNGRLEADKVSMYYMDLLKQKLDALKGDE